MIGNLQILRTFAATGVIIYHCKANIFGIHTELYGVSLFFVLSGFLMCKVSNRTAFDFLKNRTLRIVPNYWLGMILLLALFNMWTYWPAEHIYLSALFIPHSAPSGLHPLLGVGWTLNLEMYFYTIFAVSIFINKRYAPLITSLIILAIKFGLPYFTKNIPLLFYYTNPSVFFFLVGIAFWYLTEWIKLKKLNFLISKKIVPLSLALYVVSVLMFEAEFISVPMLFFMLIFASMYGADIKSSSVVLLGNASYACYLLHTIFIEFLRHKGIQTSGTILYTTIIVFSSWTIAVLWFLYVESLITKIRMFLTESISLKKRESHSPKI